jgi:hypothetical protein
MKSDGGFECFSLSSTCSDVIHDLMGAWAILAVLFAAIAVAFGSEIGNCARTQGDR